MKRCNEKQIYVSEVQNEITFTVVWILNGSQVKMTSIQNHNYFIPFQMLSPFDIWTCEWSGFEWFWYSGTGTKIPTVLIKSTKLTFIEAFIIYHAK